MSRARSASSISVPRPATRDHLDRERSAEQRADDQAVDRGDRPQRRLERVAPDDARARHAAGERRQHERLADHLAHRLRLQPLEHRRERQRERRRRQHEVVQEVEERAARRDRGRSHAADRKPSGARRDEDEQQRRQQRRHRQQHQRHGADRAGQDAAAPAAGDDAERQADGGREDSAVSARIAVFAARSGIRSRTGRS